MKGVVNSIDGSGAITCIGENGEFYHSYGKPYKELSENPIALYVGDGVEFEAGSGKSTAHITKIERTGIKDMKKKILQGIEDIKGMRAECVSKCGAICSDADLSHEGKINRMNQAIAEFRQKADGISDKLVYDLEDAIHILDEQESRIFREKRESADYAIRLNSTLELLKVSADRMTDKDIMLSVEQFANDPMAIDAIKSVLGYKRVGLAPADSRGQRQETLRHVISNVQSSVGMLTDIKFQESGFPGSFAVNGFNISAPALVMFDMAFVESLTDDCTAEQVQEEQKEENPDFGFDRLRSAYKVQDFHNTGI